MNRLTDFDYEGKLIQVRNDGMYNLTQMCQANEKYINDFLKLKSTQAYLKELESDTKIPLSQLLVVKKGNCQHWEQGTWGHKYIAIKLARWVNVKFELWCDKNIFALMDKGEAKLKPQTIEVKAEQVESDREKLELKLAPIPTVREIREATDFVKDLYGLSYAQRYATQKMKVNHPRLSLPSPLQEEKASLPTAQALLTPTQIAGELHWYYSSGNSDARKVNIMLEHLGYQVKIAGSWSATDKAVNANLCDRKPVDTNSRTQKDQLLWSAKIIDILQEHSVV